MNRACLGALLSHWRRNPLQLFAFLAGLALATALWSGVQAINAEARASYAAAAATLGDGQFDLNKVSHNSLASMTLGTGVGVGLIQNGCLLRNRKSFHPEISHIKINAFESRAQCGCGQQGCIEAFISGKNFPKYWALKSKTTEVSAEVLTQKALQGDAIAGQAFDHYSELLAYAVNSLALIGSPEVIYFSGGFSQAADLFLEKTNKFLSGLLVNRREGLDYLPKLEVSSLKETAGVIGAACVAFNGPNRF